MDKAKLQLAIEVAKEMQAPWVEVDGIKIPLVELKVHDVELEVQTEDELKRVMAAIEDEYTDEEIMYYATPHFDELQEKKKARHEALLKEKEVKEPA